MVQGSALNILLIEDNADHAELVKRCFEQHKILNTVRHVSDGESALFYLFGMNEYCNREEYPLPDFILLDLRIPKIDGLELLVKIKEEPALRHIPVVVLTSSSNEKDIAKAYENYVNSYLVKPLDFQKLSTLITELGFYWLCWNKSTNYEINKNG